MGRAVVNPAVEYVGHLLDDPATTLTTNARFVIAEIARHWNRRLERSWIGQGQVLSDGTRTGLMKTTRLSERAIRYAFREIEVSGYVIAEARAGKSTAWRFPLLTLEELGTPASDAPRHVVPPSTESRGARGAARGARGAPTPARGAPEPIEEPVKRTSAVASVESAGPRFVYVGRDFELPPWAADPIARHVSAEVWEATG